MRILAVDPGRTTGYCYAAIVDGMIKYCPFQMVDDVDEFWNRMVGFKPEYIVMEDFEFRGGARRGLDLFPVQLIGVARLYEMKAANNRDLKTRLFLQKAATGKAYYTDPTLKQSSLYIRGVPHGMDASRHLLQWFTFGFGHQFQSKAHGSATLVGMEAFDL